MAIMLVKENWASKHQMSSETEENWQRNNQFVTGDLQRRRQIYLKALSQNDFRGCFEDW